MTTLSNKPEQRFGIYNINTNDGQLINSSISLIPNMQSGSHNANMIAVWQGLNIKSSSIVKISPDNRTLDIDEDSLEIKYECPSGSDMSKATLAVSETTNLQYANNIADIDQMPDSKDISWKDLPGTPTILGNNISFPLENLENHTIVKSTVECVDRNSKLLSKTNRFLTNTETKQEDNTVVVKIGDKNVKTPNTPLVTVGICDGSECKYIENVELNTGIVGLVLNQSAIDKAEIKLDPLQYDDKNIYTCKMFGGKEHGRYIFSQMFNAYVSLGEMHTSNPIPIRVVNDYEDMQNQVPLNCKTKTGLATETNVNGILGISPLANLPNIWNKDTILYLCSQSMPDSCINITDSDIAEEIPQLRVNPISKFDQHNNGFILKIPNITEISTSEPAKGRLIFGLNTSYNNKIDNKVNIVNK